ncbi:hypothetical protein MACJ_003937 [Theileria orientalis]|uniref:Uncharacterized protein n=1 Tax=Theileria orientalis TaxID=68886 RepID=A0A976XJF3_THEOR|nr:hypothetical protein MACJ_003937 [Theileria orientalis]
MEFSTQPELIVIKETEIRTVVRGSGAVVLWYYFNFHIKDHTFWSPEQIREHKEKQHKAEIEVNDAKGLLDMITEFIMKKLGIENEEQKEEALKKELKEHLKLEDKQPQPPPKPSGCTNALCEDCKLRVGKDGVFTLISPLMMYWGINPYMSFLFPEAILMDSQFQVSKKSLVVFYVLSGQEYP